ncbi:MAG: thymidine phosphorylase [Planctomycetota bacterium]
MQNHPARLIARKRDGEALGPDEIQDLVDGVCDGSLGDAQLGALLMAVCCNGMTAEETGALTAAMRDSGRVLDHARVDRRKVDKHSTGGVGDKVSLLLAPMVAAAGVAVPMMSGRGLGHTGGTLDKLESLPGYRVNLSVEEFSTTIERCGYAMTAPSGELAPADQRMYATRDVTGTVESIPLITSSILAKKLAEGIDALVLDVKCGRAAFLPELHDAEQLAESLVQTGRAMGIDVTALLTDMDHPLGLAIGNAVEVREVLAALEGDCPTDLRTVTLALGAEMLRAGGVAEDVESATATLEQLWQDGVVRQVFGHNLELQGGNPRVLDDPSLLPRAAHVVPVEAVRAGFVEDVEPLELGRVVVDLGGGRKQPSDPVDPSVGVVLRRELGDEVQPGDVLAFVHASTKLSAQTAAERCSAAIVVGDQRGRRGAMVKRRMG